MSDLQATLSVPSKKRPRRLLIGSVVVFLLVVSALFVLAGFGDPIEPNLPSQEVWARSKPAFEAAVRDAPSLAAGGQGVQFAVADHLGDIAVTGAYRDSTGIYFSGEFSTGWSWQGENGIAYLPNGPSDEPRSLAYAQIEGPWYATITTF